jgi:hypothetical protein
LGYDFIDQNKTTMGPHAITRISHTELLEHELLGMVDIFFHHFGVVPFLKKAGACKEKGVPAVSIVRGLFLFGLLSQKPLCNA